MITVQLERAEHALVVKALDHLRSTTSPLDEDHDSIVNLVDYLENGVE